MDSRTGDLYPTKEAALAAGVPEQDVVELKGEESAVKRCSEGIKALNRMLSKPKRQSLK